MKIAIIQYGSKSIAWQYEKTKIINEAYCKRWGYDYIFEEISEDGNGDTERYMYKPTFIRKHMDGYDWILYMDSDAWVNDFGISLEDKIAENDGDGSRIMVCRHTHLYDKEDPRNNYVNAGVMLINVCKETKEFVEKWRDIPEIGKKVALKSGLGDQYSFIGMLMFDRDANRMVKIMEDMEMNMFTRVYGEEQLRKGFILHGSGSARESRHREKMLKVIKMSMEKNAIPIN